MAFQDSTLQIFLTIYHGSLIGTFFYDYIIRNIIRLVLNGPDWTYISNIALGVLFLAIIVWAILSVWSKIRRNLLISLIVLIIIFIIRLAVGIPDTMDKSRYQPKKAIHRGIVRLLAQVAVHVFGIIATWLLANNSA